MTTVDFLHHGSPPTCIGVEPATLGAEGQRQTNQATQPAGPGHQHSPVDAVTFPSYPRHARLERDLEIWLAKEMFDKL
ncbi:hypothetical protein TNCV_1833451 [Trichonephila clavipes]|nr:hypothetical protein TNCV_1833451 [Trichonephila clavipes]